VSSYAELIARKSAVHPTSGLDVDESSIAPHLFPHQVDLVRWALRRGRAAIFADTGLGKAAMLLEWARHVSQHGDVLVLAPLAVGHQLEREARKFGVSARYVRTMDEFAANTTRICITNYERLDAFSERSWAGVVLDESSILKSFDGRTKQRLIEAFAATRYKLACTATPAPNDFAELGNHAEFLGVKSRAEMLAEFFSHDGGSTKDWRVKGHAVVPFWRWVASWGAVVRTPADLGHDDSAYRLPPLEMREHVVAATGHDVNATGLLFAMPAQTLAEQRAARRGTITSRVSKAIELIEPERQAVIWCELNDEQDAIADALGERCVSIQGTDEDDEKIARHERWLSGSAQVLVSKAAIFGFGCNWQHCHHQIFVGPSNSYERTYQAIRRCWRFGQTRPVIVDMVRSDLESEVMANYRRKEADAARMAAEVSAHASELVRAEVRGLTREWNPYKPSTPMAVPDWIGG
jgi:superfamily II DNA or RNA helicase